MNLNPNLNPYLYHYFYPHPYPYKLSGEVEPVKVIMPIVGSVVFGVILGWFALVENPKLVQQLRRELQYAPRTPSTGAATISAVLVTARTKLPVLPSITLRLPDKQSVANAGDPEGEDEGD
jgi:hypothetical protein